MINLLITLSELKTWITEMATDNISERSSQISMYFAIAGFIIIIAFIVQHKRKAKEKEKKFEEKYKEYSDFSHNEGNSWDYENARTYANMGNDFNNSNDRINEHSQRYNYNNYNNDYNKNNASFQSSSTGNDFYSMFENVTPDIAKTVYLNLVKKYHSDNNDGNNESEEIIKEINEAYGRYKENIKKNGGK